MYFRSVKEKFEAAHFLSGYHGTCANMHGHTWKVEAIFHGDKLDRLGMLVDIKTLKRALFKVTGQLDHGCINSVLQTNVEDTQANPTPENVAEWIFKTLEKETEGLPVVLHSVIVWEEEDAWASVTK